MNKKKICISAGNMKLGKMANFSLTPGQTCSKAACSTCYVEGCYARKAYRLYPQTKTAWDKNTEFAKENIPELKAQLSSYFAKSQPRFFRIHVAGDFVSKEYAEMWRDVIAGAPGTRFLAFTKQYEIAKAIEWPENVAMIFSAWPGLEFDRTGFNVAWMDDGTETRVPADAIMCPGSCENCGMCFQLPELKRDVVFHKH